MKILYTLLLTTAIGLGANAATNNNADKILHIENKALFSNMTSNYPTIDGGSYLTYHPYVMFDSFSVSRLDASGSLLWTKKFIKTSMAPMFTTTADNGFLFIGQDPVLGSAIIKLNASGNIEYLNTLWSGASFDFQRAEDSYITVGGMYQGHIWFNELEATGLNNNGVMISTSLSFETNWWTPTITYIPSTAEITASAQSNGKIALVKADTAENVLLAKTYSVSGTPLEAYAHLRLRDGNIVLVGVNRANNNSFIIKVDGDDGAVLLAKEYTIAYGTHNTTVSNQAYTINGGGFYKVVEMPNGNLALSTVTNFSGSTVSGIGAVTVVSSNGAFVNSTHAFNDREQLSDAMGQRFERLVNMNGATDGYYIGLSNLNMQANSTTMLSVSKIEQLCNAVAGTATVTDLTIAVESITATATEWVAVQSTGSITAYDSQLDIVEEASCFEAVQSLPTAIAESAAISFALIPNPTTAGSTVMLRLEDPSQVQRINLIDLNGKILLSTTDISAENTITLSGVASGTYIVQLQGSKQTTNRKLIVLE